MLGGYITWLAIQQEDNITINERTVEKKRQQNYESIAVHNEIKDLKNQIKYLVLNLAVGRGVFFFDLIREWKQKVAMPFLAVYILDDVGSFLQSFGWHWFNSDGLVLVYWVGSTR